MEDVFDAFIAWTPDHNNTLSTIKKRDIQFHKVKNKFETLRWTKRTTTFLSTYINTVLIILHTF